MRVILILWAIPVVLFWGWYGLSAYNINFGFFFLSRGFHDHIFQIYGNILQMPAEDVPVALAWIFGVDSLIVFGVAALRWYKHWLPQTYNYLKTLFTGTPSKAHLETRVEDVLMRSSGVKAGSIGPVRPAE